MKITFRGWPWQYVSGHWAHAIDNTEKQRWGWNPLTVKGMGRFGGGWAFKFGVNISGSLKEWIFDLGIGSVRLKFGGKEVEG